MNFVDFIRDYDGDNVFVRECRDDEILSVMAPDSWVRMGEYLLYRKAGRATRRAAWQVWTEYRRAKHLHDKRVALRVKALSSLMNREQIFLRNLIASAIPQLAVAIDEAYVQAYLAEREK